MQSTHLKLKLNQNALSKNATYQVGFSLVELMVGLVIGLFATLAIMQVFGAFEGQKRTTSGTADAQTNGSVALYNLQRDVRLGGYGLPLMDDANLGLKCSATTLSTTAVPPHSLSIPINIVPVVIQDGVAATDSDSITVNYGATNNAGLPVEVSALESQVGDSFPVNIINNMNCRNSDIVIAINDTNCVAQQITTGPPFSGAISLTMPLPRAAGPASTHITLYSNAGITAGSKISCVTGWNSVTYSVVNNQLMRGVTAMVDGIVNMQAQYGISATPDSNQITQWVNATGAWAAPGITALACNAANANRNCIKAVRVAIVARNGLLERPPAVSTACSSTTAANPTGVCAWDATSANPSVASPAPTVNLTNTPSWGQYRYRVYESIIPLRNVVWTKDRLS